MRRSAFFLVFLVAPCLAMAQTSTTTTLTSTPATLAQGQVETTVVTVTAASGVPTGTVQLLGDGAVVATTALSNGSATIHTNTSSVAPGTYTVVAKYEGGGGFAASTSQNVSVTVTAPSPTTTALTASPTDIQLGATAYLIARVGRNSGGTPPTGTVAFYAGGELGTAPLVNGIAKLSASAAGVPQGKYSVTAKYLGANGDASSVSPAVAVSVTPAVDVLTSRYNSRRTGVQSQETILTPANVNSATFGKIATYAVDGYLYAQPLYISSYKMSDGSLHNVVIASTAAGTVYAFDADGKNPSAGYLWKQSILANGEAVQDTSDYGCGNPSPNTGILGTPVADRNTGAIYVIGAVKTTSNGTTTYAQKLHALRISDGTEILNGPTVIQASVPGTGAGTSGGMVSFNPLRSAERAAMLEASGQVWIMWASHCDAGPYHGWTMAYNAADISKQTAVNNNTPNGSDGGIWMTAAGSSSDDQDNIFTASGNGTFDVNTGGSDYGDSVSRLAYTPASGSTAASLSVGDWFVPDDQSYLSEHDQDMGMVAPLLIQDPGGSEPDLLVNADKTGQIYLLDRDNLGTYDMGTKGPDGLNDAVQQWSTGSIFSSFAWFNNTLYIGATGTNLAAYTFTPGTSTTPGQFNTTPASKTAHSFGGGSAGGIQPVISANGTSNAILWGLDNSTASATLYAYDPANLATMFYASTTASGSRDQGPPSVKFTLPVVANGKVFVGGQGQLVVYGLLGQ